MFEFSPSALKNALFKTKSTPTEIETLDTRVYLRRLTMTELIGHEDTLIEAQTSGNTRIASELDVQIVIDSLVHPDGSLIRAKDKPAVKELLAVHDNVVLLNVIDKVKKYVIDKSETTKKN